MGIQVCLNEEPRPFPRGYNKEIAIQVCSNEGTCPFPGGDNYEKVKIY